MTPRKQQAIAPPQAEQKPAPAPIRRTRTPANAYPDLHQRSSTSLGHVAVPDNLGLEHLKRIQVDLSGIRGVLGEHTRRLGRLEVAIAGLRRDIAQNEEGSAEFSVRIDRLAQRIARIERRLELAD